MKKLSVVMLAVLAVILSISSAFAASPLTGDSSHMGLWIAMVGVAILAVIVILILLRKKK